MKVISGAKNIAFGLFIAVLFFALIEVTFRLLSIGEPDPMFVPYKASQNQLIINPEIAKTVFFRNDENLIPQIDPFDKQKTNDIFRVFVLGASTAYGFPFSHNTSFPRILERSLQSNTFKKVEVINLSLTAINTYTLREFASQLPQYNPDMVLVYAGHNEYYGIHGVASSYSFASGKFKSLYFLAKKLYFFNWLERKISSSKNDQSQNQDANLMKKLSAENFIPHDSKEFQAGIDQFSNNLEDIIKILAEENIPIFIGTLTSNLTSIIPLDFSSTRDENLASVKVYREAITNFQSNNPNQSTAKFEAARFYDQLRFRAPIAFNQAIRNKLASEGVKIVEVDSAFGASNRKSNFSNDLFMEHVHPTIKGYYLMAMCFHNSIVQDPLFKNDFSREYKTLDNYRELFDAQTTPLDSVYGSRLVYRLLNQWPFNYNIKTPQENSLEEKIASEMMVNKVSWPQAMDIYVKTNLKNGNHEAARQGALSLMQEIPLSPQPIIYYLESLLLMEKWDELLAYSLIYVERDKPNFDLISSYVNKVFERSESLEDLEVYLTENSEALGEFGFYLEGVLENRLYQAANGSSSKR